MVRALSGPARVAWGSRVLKNREPVMTFIRATGPLPRSIHVEGVRGASRGFVFSSIVAPN